MMLKQRNMKSRGTQSVYSSLLSVILVFFAVACSLESYAVTGYTGSSFTGSEGVGNSISPANSGGTTSIIRNTSWNDVEFNCTNISTSQGTMNMGVVFRHTSNSAYYAVTYEHSWGGQYITRLKSNNHQVDNTTGQIASYSSGSATTAMKIEVVGSSIKVYINGTLRIDVSNSTHTTGNVGFIKTATWNVATVRWSSCTWAEIISAVAPTISTTAISSITCGTASSGGNTINDGGGTISAKGIVWGTSSSPTTGSYVGITNDGGGTGDFSSSLSGLSAGQTYYVRAYATNEAGTSYGANASFTALSSVTAGSIGSAQTICHSATPATLTQTGAPTGGSGSFSYQWQSSADNAAWSDIGGATAATYSPGALTSNTYYRRQVSSSDCNTASSASVLITVDPASVGGSITSDATVCSGSNAGTLTLSGHTGSIVKWQKSENGGAWTDITNTTTTQAYTNLTVTTAYRAVIQSGVCSTTNSGTATITIDPVTVGGSISSAATECYGSNSATLTLSGHTGSIVKWQYSEDNWATPVDIANVTTTQVYTNLTATTKYRAVVQSGTCSSANSSEVTITVNPQLNPGVVKF